MLLKTAFAHRRTPFFVLSPGFQAFRYHLRVPAPSLTSTDSFHLRAQRSELQRAGVMIAALLTLAALITLRRFVGGAVMASDRVFFPLLLVFLIGAGANALSFASIRAALRAGRILPTWRWRLSAIADLVGATAAISIGVFLSPRGPVTALSAPAVLLFPLILILSIFRLRPAFTLATGLAAALIHILLTCYAIGVAHPEAGQHPALFSYGFGLAILGAAGFIVARDVKRYLLEAVDEATAHEQASAKLAAVQRDLSVARDIQRGLLPAAAPAFPGFDIAGMSRPADLTGGDYYDWQPLPDGRLAVVMADVTGHGIGPALVMAVCRAYARATTPLAADSAALLNRLNNLIHADITDGRFITFALAIIDAAGRVDLLSAGHGPTLLYRASTGKVEEFGGDGIPLGIAPDESYGPVRTFTLEPDDALLLLTDGFLNGSAPSTRRPSASRGFRRRSATPRATAPRTFWPALTRPSAPSRPALHSPTT